MVGDELWLLDLAGDPYLHIVDTTTRRIVRSVGRRGEGPRDFRGAVTFFQFRPGDTTAYVFDDRLHRITELAQGARGGAAQPTPRMVDLAAAGIGWVIPMRDSSMLGLSFRGKHYFNKIAITGQIIDTFALRLPGADSVMTEDRRQSINGSSVCPMWDRSGFAMVYPYAGRIQLYGDDVKLKREAAVPLPSNETFLRRTRGEGHALAEPVLSYVDCAFSAEWLFAIVSSESRVGRQIDGSIVHVFTIDGSFSRSLQLGARITSLLADSTGSTLIGVDIHEGLLFRFRL
jgi:hypothetical protein